jgi:Flp pilus assembly protein TadD
MNKLGEAEATFKKAIELKPNEATFHFNLGVIYRRQQKVKEAIAEYEQAVKLDDRLDVAHYDLGIMYRNEKRSEDAIREMNRYLDLIAAKNPKEAEIVRKHIKEMGGKPSR